MKPRFLLDTSCLVAAVCSWHMHHEATAAEISRRLSRGEEPVMAAPDADVGKLTPVIQSYYDLERSGSDVFTEEVIIKPQAHKLLESDMPSRNPQLVAKTIEQMTLA